MSSFRALSEVIGGARALLALCRPAVQPRTGTRPRPAARWTRTTSTQVGRALQRLGIVADPGLFARSQGAVRAHVRHLAEAPAPGTQLAGITGIDEANRFLKEVYLPQHNARFALPGRGRRLGLRLLRRRARRYPLHPRERTVSNDNTVPTSAGCSSSPPTAIAATTIKATVRECTSIPTARSPSSTGPDAWRDTKPSRRAHRQAGRVIHRALRRDRPKPCKGQPLRA